MAEFTVNTDESKVFARGLQALKRSAFPNAIRETLNELAKDVKKNTMPKEAERNFTVRQKNFFKATSKINYASGFNVRTMESMVGFVSNRPKDQAVEDLEQQEHGGVIKGRAFIAMHQARRGKSVKGLVQKRNQIRGIRNVVRTSEMSGKTESEKLLKAIHEAGKGGHVLTKTKGATILFRVNSLRKTKTKGFNLTAVQSYKKGRTVKIGKGTNFMRTASEKTAKKGNDIFIKEAVNQFNRALRK